jgi:hypothetical protein
MRRTADWNAFLEERLAALGDENGSLGTAK